MTAETATKVRCCVLLGCMTLAFVVCATWGPESVAIFPIGLAALFLGSNPSEAATSAALVYPWIVYAVLFGGIALASARWLHVFLILLSLLLLLNIGGCASLIGGLRRGF